jgi:hypothetical protein
MQIDFLRHSCDAYDQGRINEVVRLATTLRTLLHDTKKSHSLLAQLDMKHRMHFVSTGFLSEKENGGFIGAPLVPVGGPIPLRHVALLHEAQIEARQTFRAWWKATVIGTMQGNFSRERLVLLLANQEGGAHVDPSTEDEYSILTEHGLRLIFSVGDAAFTSPGNPVPPTLRQIAFEFEATASTELVDLLTSADCLRCP